MVVSRDEAVRYAPDFAGVGYSHGCVGMRDMVKATWLFGRVPVGTRVFVHWSSGGRGTMPSS
jgi:L,D-transpeptidase catalytic domain